MPDSGVSVDAIVRALRATEGVSAARNPDGSVTIVKGGKFDTIFFEPPIEKKMLFRLEHRYGTPIYWFYRPDMIPGEEEKGKPN